MSLKPFSGLSYKVKKIFFSSVKQQNTFLIEMMPKADPVREWTLLIIRSGSQLVLIAQHIFMAGFGVLSVEITQRHSKVYIMILVLLVKTLNSVKSYRNSREQNLKIKNYCNQRSNSSKVRYC